MPEQNEGVATDNPSELGRAENGDPAEPVVETPHPEENMATVNGQPADTATTPLLQATTGGGAAIAGSVTVGGHFAGRDLTIIQQLTPEGAEILIRKLRQLEQAPKWNGQAPFVGLSAFQEGNAEFFFGRERMIQELVEQLGRWRFVCVTGPSGSGKSSLVRAGLLPALRRGAIEGSRNWLLVLFAPRDHPLDQLRDALMRLSPEADALYRRLKAAEEQPAPVSGDGSVSTPEQTRRDAFARQISLLFKWVELLSPEGSAQKCVIIVDQFEELFTQTSDEIERISFVRLLTEFADSAKGQTLVILTLRSDFISPCARYPRLRALISQQFHLVGAMEPEELLQAIVKPLVKVDATIEPPLVATIINDMRGEPGELPLLQFALNDLFAATTRREGDEIALTLEQYTKKGGIYGILKSQADNALKKLGTEQEVVARHIFSSVVELRRDAPSARRVVSFSELVSQDATPEAIDAVLAGLTASDARLLIAGIPSLTIDSQSPPPDQFAAKWQNVTLAHEKLIIAWPWLVKLVSENREWRLHQQRIDEARRAWQPSKSTSDLLRGQQLTKAREWAREKPHWVTKEQNEFLKLSRRGEIRRRLSNVALLLPLLLLVLFVGLNLWMFVQRQQADWQPIEGFPSQVVTAVAVAFADQDDSTRQPIAPLACVGTNDLGVGCTYDGVAWNLYKRGLPNGTPGWFTSRDRPWGSLIGAVWAAQVSAVYAIQFDQQDHTKLYAFLRDKGLYHSGDGGVSWSVLKIEDAPVTFPTVGASKIAADGDYLFVASGWANSATVDGRLFVSANAGRTWASIEGDGFDTGEIKDFWLVRGQPNEPRTLYFVSTTGLFRASEPEQWQPSPVVSAVGESQFIWLTQDEAKGDYYIAGYNADKNWSYLYRWPGPGNGLEQLGDGHADAIRALTVNPGNRVPGLVWLLFENSEVVAVDAQGVFRSYGSRPGWLWAQGYGIWFARTEVGDYLPFVAHNDGILECKVCLGKNQ